MIQSDPEFIHNSSTAITRFVHRAMWLSEFIFSVVPTDFSNSITTIKV
jgi:hypothetical protein